MKTDLEITLFGSGAAENANKFIVQRVSRIRFGPRYWHRRTEYHNIGDVLATPGKDAVFVDVHAEYDRRYTYRYKAVHGARSGEWVYVSFRTPPAPTPIGQCTPESPTWYTYTVTHPIVDLTGYYKVQSPGIAYNSENESICFIYASKINMWLFVRLSSDLTVRDVQTAGSTSICKLPGVYYYTTSSSSEWIPRHSRYWLANQYYKNVTNIVNQKPSIECWRELTDIEYGITPIPTFPPKDKPEEDIVVTPPPTPTRTPVPTPSPSPTQLISLRNRLLHESGQPLLAEDGRYLLPES
jgi:hypothetical protein